MVGDSKGGGDRVKASAEYLGHLGCRISVDRAGTPKASLTKRNARLKSLRDEFGAKPPLDDKMVSKLLRQAEEEGRWTRISAALGLSDNALLEICGRHAQALGIPMPEKYAPWVERHTGHLLIACITATHIAHTRFDKLYCFAASGDGTVSRISWGAVMEALETGGYGWLTRREPPAILPDPGLDEWMKGTLGRIRARAVEHAKRDLWLFGRLQRDLLAEEERLLRLHYSDLAAEFLEPLRRLHMRISEANERRNQARSMKTAQAGAAELRRLKGMAGEEESRLGSSKTELQDELDSQLAEVKRRYSLGSRLGLNLVSLLTYEFPILRIPGGLLLEFSPFTGAPTHLRWDGGGIRIEPGICLAYCSEGHIYKETEAYGCGCGNALCPECIIAGGPPASCDICGDYLCPECSDSDGRLCPACAEETRLTATAFDPLT